MKDVIDLIMKSVTSSNISYCSAVILCKSAAFLNMKSLKSYATVATVNIKGIMSR